MHLISEGLDVAQPRIFCLKDGLVRDVEIKETLLSQIVPSHFLALLIENSSQRGHKLLSLVPVAGEEVGKTHNTLLLIPQALRHLAQVFFALLGQTAGRLVNLHLFPFNFLISDFN